MVNFALSFDKGIPIANAINLKGEVKHLIRIKRDQGENPDITTENIFDILTSEDVDSVSRSFRLSNVERKVLLRAIKKDSPERLNEKLKEAFLLLVEILEDKLKKELEFDDNITVIPAIGHKDAPFDRHIFILFHLI